MRIIKSSNNYNTIACNEHIGSKAVGSFLSSIEDENLKNSLIKKAIELINNNYISPYKEYAIKDIENPEIKEFYLRSEFGGDFLSEPYPTHASATWHIWNDKDENGELKWISAGSPFVYVWEHPGECECPECGEKQFFNIDGDICAFCNAWVEI